MAELSSRISPDDPFADQIHRLADRLIRRLMRHRDRYLKAWIAATGLRPQEALIEEHQLPLGIKQFIVRRRIDQYDLVDRLARLLKTREWTEDDLGYSHCVDCGACWLIPPTSPHKPGCQLAAALREAGMEVKVQDD